ncbi:P-loop containing nucleoside triphosphate hydrolase protein [Aspergillus novoparasiticus]|uniref:P-loop containing nucleoside triphosphate hydrolase protein n=1 Tax=Aspergillus novoparasiticus TaxID=986946 RepID=A0A5N6EMC6_9EURO|nr:P-loop containing nucleoside triphosphate hydrolase protein [Aspergillus novoparasiticus]
MFIVMLRALKDLKRVPYFSTAKCSGGQTGSSISTDQEAFQKLNKVDSSSGLPVGRPWKPATGSGKSTQVPQMLLDDAMVKGPGKRRESLGYSIGYQIRFDSRRPTRLGSIIYCTIGYLLNMLHSESYLVIVMSRLPARHLRIPGSAFPVGKHYLDEVIESLSRFYSPRALSLLIDEPQTVKYLRGYNLLPGIDGDQNSHGLSLPQSSPSMLREEDPLIPLGLICAVICYVLCSTEGGSMLVFLLGLRHIMAVESAVRKYGKMLSCDFSDCSRYKILQLHSNLPDGQEELFSPVSRTCRQVILSTDVAETSITILDVKFVIDPGKVNQRIYEPHSRTTRVQAREYFALFTRDMHKSFRVTRFPGMMREDLQQATLQVKRTVSSASIQDTLRDSIEPPDAAKVDFAINNLQLLRALDEKEGLTPLGLILLGFIFRCLHPLLIIWSQETHKDAHRTRVEFSRNTWRSDHLSAANAFMATREVCYRKGHAAAFEFAVSNHINFDRVYEVLQAAFGGASLNTNSWRTPLIKALLFHVMYPNLAAPSSASRRRYYTEKNEMTHMSPSSVNSTERPRSLFIFNSTNSLLRGTYTFTYFLKQISHVTPLAACLLGGQLQGSGRRICMDSWLDFLVQANEGSGGDRAARLLIELRKTTNNILDRDIDPVYSKRVNTAAQWA